MIVVWQITERCNLACPFCLYDKRRVGNRREADAKTVLRFARLLSEFQQSRQERVLISWLGGEPLLWSPLFPLSHSLREEYDLAFSVTTNGTSLQRELVQEQILASMTELTVSVDAFAEQHNAWRGWPNGWQNLRAAMQQLAQKAEHRGVNLKRRVNTVLMRDNLDSFADLCRELVTWGIQEITFNQLGGRDRPEFYPSHRLQPNDVENLIEMIPVLREELGQQGVQLRGDDTYLQRIESSSRDISIPVHDCFPGERFLFIDEQARVSPCSFTAASLGVSLNDLHTINDIMTLPARFAAARQQQLPGPCRNCTSTRVFAKFAG